MTPSDLRDTEALSVRLVELEEREAALERRLAALLETHRPDDVAERTIAALRQEHLELRRELNTIRAHLVPLSLAPNR